MGIFDALNTAVGGLQAQSFALQNISGNIANASTTGYKGIGTTFEDLIPDSTTPNKQVAGGVTAFAQATITTQGTVSGTTVGTNMAINGDGFFSVQKPTSVVDNSPVFNGVTDYTRRGDFQVNANGNLVNGAGYYLMGVAVDPKTGNPLGNVPTVLQFQNNFIPAQATTAIQYAANLPTQPQTQASSAALAGTITANGGLNPSDFASNPLPVGTAAPLVSTTITGTVVNNQMGTPVPITANTALSGTAPSDSLAAGFAAGDAITVDGTTITFVASGATGNQLNVTDNVGALLNKIAAITGATASVSTTPPTAGQISLATGTAKNLSITVASGLTPALTTSTTNALQGLGFAGGSITQARAAGTNVGTGGVTFPDLTTFTNESISGGAVTAYNTAGTPVNLQLRWAKTDSAALGSGHQDTWNLFYQANTTAATGNQAWVNTGTNFTFSASGALASPTGSSVAIPSVVVDGQALGALSLNIASGALTQFASSSGATTINGITQNGFAAGQLQSVAVNNSGLVVGTFSNGQNIPLAQVTLANFNGQDGLQALNGGAYAATQDSGPPLFDATGQIVGNSVEASNVDIATQFSDLIVAQQAYSASAKVMTTANQMMQSLLTVIQ
jgi:flagellar hook protein FlgE